MHANAVNSILSISF